MTDDYTADDDYWWQQRLNAAACVQGQQDRKEGKEPRSVHPSYIQGYEDFKEHGGRVEPQAHAEPSEGTKSETALVVVRSWLQR